MQARLDKWLWVARFYKTRSAAALAVTSGKVRVNDEHAKPGRSIRLADRVCIRNPPYETVVIVRGFSSHRGPAREAAQLYEETVDSVNARERLALMLREQAASLPPSSEGRPNKRDRRSLARLRGK